MLTASLAVLDTGSATGGAFDCRNNDSITLEIVYTKGDETSATIVVEGSLDDTVSGAYTGGTWVPAEGAADVSGSLSGGIFTTPMGYRKRTMDTSGTYPVHVSVGALHRLRVRALATGGTPTGTVAVRVAGVHES